MVETAKPLKQGYTLGKWRLGRRIGGGGQASIWEVRPTTTRRSPPKAMKVSVAADPVDRLRFEHEVDLLLHIDHENVVPIRDHNISWTPHAAIGADVSWFVTDRFDCSLDQLRLIHRAPVFCIKIFAEVCRAMAHLHRLNPPVFHRDIKPSNILYRSEIQRIALTDFGIAWAASRKETDVTRTHEVVGSPMYRAPEVLSGQRGGPQADVYSLCRTLEWMVTGHDPDEPEPRVVPRDAGFSEAACRQLNDTLKRGCSYDPQHRFPDVERLLEALPGLWADVPPTHQRGRPSTPVDSSTPARSAYAQARQMLRDSDVMWWRDYTKHRRRRLHGALRAWREEHRDAPASQTTESLQRWMDDLVERASAIIIPTLVATESAATGLAGDLDILNDVFDVVGWNPAGSAPVADFNFSFAYVLHNLLGATAISANRIELPVEIALFKVPPSARGRSADTLMSCGDVIAWPPGLGKSDDDAWQYLKSLAQRHAWLLDIFGEEHDYHVALCGYWWVLHVVEYAGELKAGKLDSADANSLYGVGVPPLLLHEDDSLRERAFRRAFPNSDAVRKVARGIGVPPDQLARRWPEWTAIMKRLAASSKRADRKRFLAGVVNVPPLPT